MKEMKSMSLSIFCPQVIFKIRVIISLNVKKLIWRKLSSIKKKSNVSEVYLNPWTSSLSLEVATMVRLILIFQLMPHCNSVLSSQSTLERQSLEGRARQKGNKRNSHFNMSNRGLRNCEDLGLFCHILRNW